MSSPELAVFQKFNSEIADAAKDLLPTFVSKLCLKGITERDDVTSMSGQSPDEDKAVALLLERIEDKLKAAENEEKRKEVFYGTLEVMDGIKRLDSVAEMMREAYEYKQDLDKSDKEKGEQLYGVMLDMSHSLPGYIVDHYIRLLAIINVDCHMKSDWSLSEKFLELYSTHVSEKSPQVAASYVHTILTGLGYDEMDDFTAYLHTEVEIDTKITEELERITKFRPAVIEVVRDELDPRLSDYQIDRYRMVLTVLRSTTFDSNKSFFELFTDLTGKLGKYPLAVSLTIGVLERSGWGDTKKLKPFSLPNFDINTSYPEVDLCLTVADYYGNMSDRDFSSAKVYTSAVHFKNHSVSNKSRIEFTLLLMKRGIIKAGDVSKIEDTVRYPIFFNEYKERCRGPSKETAPTTNETVVVPSLPVQETGATQETLRVAVQPVQETSTVLPSFLTQVKNLLSSSLNQQVQGSSDVTQANTAAVPPISDDATLSTAEKEAIAKWLKESTVELTVKRINMHGLPGSGKTCSQHLLLNEDPPKEDNSTPIACRAVKATRISVNDGHMERVDAEALLSRLAHDLKEAAAKPRKSEDHSKEKFSETKLTKSVAGATDTEDTTESIKSPHAANQMTESAEVTDDSHSNKIFKGIFDAIPEAKELDTNWLYIVDSGGQTAFQELLPLFTRAASFNIITIDLSKGIDEKLEQKYRINGEPFSCDSEFSYSNIEFLKDVLSSGAILKPYHTPQPIIGSEEDITYPGYFVLGTHKDKATQENIKQYNEKLTSLTWGSEEKGYHIIPAIENSDTIIYPVNTMLESGPEREAEAKNLCKIIYNNTSGVKFNLSVQEFVLELTLLEKAEGRSFLSIEEVLPIGRSLQMTDNETMAALENLHNVTIILYYSEILPDRVFVDPHPILDILSRLLALTYKISQNFLCKHILISRETYSQNEFKDARKSLRERGVFTQSLLEKLKDDEKFPKKDFIDLLLRLHIIIEMDEKDKKDESKKREYFIPSALPSYPKTSRPPKSDIDPLQIIWRSPVTNPEDSCEILPIPRGIFPLSVINLKKSQQLQFRFPQITRQYLRYRDAMSFRLFFKGAHIGTIHIIKKQRRIEIYFAGDASKYCSLLCEAVKEAIASSCKAIHIKPDGYEFAFACPSTDGCYRIITDEVKKEVECTLCPTPPIISREEKFWSWFDKKSLTKVKYPMMIKEFRSLLNAIKEALAMKSIDDVKSCLLDLIKVADWASEVDAVTDETSLAQLHVLGRYCFLSNLSLLKCIIEKLDLKEAIKSRIDQLAEERDAFYSEVLVEDFAAAGIEDHKMIKEHHVEMTFVVSWNSSETTLTTFQDFITKEFKDLSMFIALRAVRHSRLTFVCTVPIWAIGAIKDAIKHAADSFKNGIQQLMLNDEDILCEETDLPSLNAGGDAGPLVDDQEVRKFKCTDINQYEMNTSPASGYCLVISMSGKEENREPGNGKDVKKLRSLFKDTLKFAFKEYKNFSQSQINKLLTNVQEDNHSFSSCFVMFILAHGTTDKDGDAVFETCDKVEEEGKIVEKYYPYKVSTIKKGLEITKGLYGRPKLLFIQSCRGQINNTGVLARDDPTDEESKKLIPFGSDFLMSFATIKEHAAYRHQDGSPFIRHLWYVFNTYHNTHDVLSMMTIVVMRMSVWSGTTDNGLLVKQIPEFTSTLRKFLYFRDASEEKKSKKSHSK